MSRGEGSQASPSGAADACRVVLFTAPHARAPAHLVPLRRQSAGFVVTRCRTLVEFARALKTLPWNLVVVDCGPGNPRLADVASIYRRSGTSTPLVVVGEPTPGFAAALADLPACEVVAPEDPAELLRALTRQCPDLAAGGNTQTAECARDVSAEVVPLDRAAFVELLRRPLVLESASAIVVVMDLGSAASPTPLAGPGLAALEAIDPAPVGVAVLAPNRLAALLDPGPADPARGADLAGRLRQQIEHHAAPAEATAVAVALCPSRPSDRKAEHWLERAERACCEVAAHTEHGYAVLSRIPAAAPTAGTVPALVQDALAGNRMTLVFQPIVSLRGDPREHYEALLRLPTVAAGEMLPGDFFAAAEAAGLMPAIDQWVVRTAIRRLATERGQGRRTHFFVAISAPAICDEGVVATICDELAAAKARGDWLTVQLRARDVRRHETEARRLVSGLRRIHCRIALDRYDHDVTTQELVAGLRIDFVKLSRALTQAVAADQSQLATLCDTVRWLTAQGASSVATAVEDAHALAYLWTAGIDYVQGFFLQEPTGDIAYDDAG